jgi:hypothetical protein
MDINKALALLRGGKLRECSIGDLRAMSAGCVVFIQNRIPDAIHLKEAVDDEIRRQEAAEAQRQSDAAARQMHEEATTLDREAIAESKRANHLSVRAIVIALIALIVSALAWLFPRSGDAPASPDVRHSRAPSLQVSNTAPLVLLSATNATASGLRIVSGKGFQDMPLGCSTEVVEAIMGHPQEKKVYGTDVYYSYKLSNRLTYLERRGLLHNEKDIGFVFDQATLKLKKIFIEDSFAVKTDRGIEFGDAVGKVLKLYGTPTKTYPENIGTAFDGWLAFTNDGITFDFNAGVVTGFDILGTPK